MTIIYGTDRSVLNGINRPNRVSALTSRGVDPTVIYTNPAYTWAATGSVTTSTTEFKYGTASALYPSDGSYVKHTGGPDYNFWPSGTQDWTLEWWQYLPTGLATGPIMHVAGPDGTSGALGVRLGTSYNANNYNGLGVFARAQADLDYASVTWTLDTWQHVAVVREYGVDLRMYVDGIEQSVTHPGGGNAISRSFTAISSANQLQIGRANDRGMRGNARIDDFRVSTAAIYPAGNFTPPTAAANLGPDTVLCMNMDGSNGGTTFDNRTSSL